MAEILHCDYNLNVAIPQPFNLFYSVLRMDQGPTDYNGTLFHTGYSDGSTACGPFAFEAFINALRPKLPWLCGTMPLFGDEAIIFWMALPPGETPPDNWTWRDHITVPIQDVSWGAGPENQLLKCYTTGDIDLTDLGDADPANWWITDFTDSVFPSDMTVNETVALDMVDLQTRVDGYVKMYFGPQASAIVTVNGSIINFTFKNVYNELASLGLTTGSLFPVLTFNLTAC